MITLTLGDKRVEIKPRYNKFVVMDERGRVIKVLDSPEVERYMIDKQNKGWELNEGD